MLSDLDVAFDLKRRIDGDNEYLAAREVYVKKAKASGRTFSTFVDELYWPRVEVQMKLKGRSPVISLHEFYELDQLAAPCKIVFEAD
jgi:hypothetical protein